MKILTEVKYKSEEEGRNELESFYGDVGDRSKERNE